ncbi:hypothetical protein [Kytococcus sedentarius]|uniref:hypothetical protein n=1 Tax=Kytococcus sedentarius TaxID=1276 RepID=UPI0035BBC576
MSDPTFSRVPTGDEAAGEDCLALADAYGIGLDDWQRDVVRGILRETGGTWSASQAGLVVGRQNGKGQILVALELFGLFALGESILHTAHAVKTSSDAFRRLWGVIQSHDDLAQHVTRHSQMIGAEYVALESGARIAFTTRSASAGRGLSIDRLVVDEAEDLPAAEVGALAPTVFSRPHAQSLYFGTAPGPMHDAEAFHRMRESAHVGDNARLAWWEWCAEWGADPSDRDLWVRVNPAVASGRVPVAAIENDHSILPPDQFRAERLSMWAPRTAASEVFDRDAWETAREPDSMPTGSMAVGIDAPPSRSEATVCLAGRREDGRIHLEWYITEPGVTWLPEWVAVRLNKNVRAVAVDRRNAVAELDWHAAGVRPTVCGAREVAAAAGALWDAVADGQVRHRGQVELTKGIHAAQQRAMMGGQGFTWERRASGSSVLLAASLAVWGLEYPEVERPRRAKRGERGDGTITVL